MVRLGTKPVAPLCLLRQPHLSLVSGRCAWSLHLGRLQLPTSACCNQTVRFARLAAMSSLMSKAIRRGIRIGDNTFGPLIRSDTGVVTAVDFTSLFEHAFIFTTPLAVGIILLLLQLIRKARNRPSIKLEQQACRLSIVKLVCGRADV